MLRASLNDRRVKVNGAVFVAGEPGSLRGVSLLFCNGEKFRRRSEKSRPKDEPLDEVKMLVRDVLVELEGVISV